MSISPPVAASGSGLAPDRQAFLTAGDNLRIGSSIRRGANLHADSGFKHSPRCPPRQHKQRPLRDAPRQTWYDSISSAQAPHRTCRAHLVCGWVCRHADNDRCACGTGAGDHRATQLAARLTGGRSAARGNAAPASRVPDIACSGRAGRSSTLPDITVPAGSVAADSNSKCPRPIERHNVGSGCATTAAPSQHRGRAARAWRRSAPHRSGSRPCTASGAQHH
ncbi:hypothetical protein EV283_3797 [Sphingomonas sp. BK036]|nr:hypothetical protein EV283_3797 [Sphingomonas sp. BK036]